ncbi:hypothetical protein HPQ64_09630 [Rhizobiales bacterium]|uniref:hypothetical protein n=1 Tax=Hongsoonwoonella zoysiae TaxID=2821844 RepID=UPI0015615FA1|nr:hypothetical protein [Hongsoonwoonella zoysiae]NRG17946.1 hypothetical protein [Hongsoonwoonella zoysiae]
MGQVDDRACISHVELHGPNGIRYVHQYSDRLTLYSARHRANETIFFKNRELPSVTANLTLDTDAMVKTVTASSEDEVFSKSARLRDQTLFERSGKLESVLSVFCCTSWC